MKCAWQAYVNLVPIWLKQDVDQLGRDKLQELRMRIGQPPELATRDGSRVLDRQVSLEDLQFVVNAASEYSPWAASTSTSGYITASGGHRIGICGDMTVMDGRIRSVRSMSSLSLRVARDFPGIGLPLAGLKGSTLIIGVPGAGKTTLLRDLVRQKSNAGVGVAVVDERKEIFPMYQGSFCFPPGSRTDVLSGCSKVVGIPMVLRTMSPQIIAVDEITDQSDCEAMLHAGWCGVTLLATAHAGSRRDMEARPLYRSLVQCGVFQNLVILRSDKSWVLERMDV